MYRTSLLSSVRVVPGLDPSLGPPPILTPVRLHHWWSRYKRPFLSSSPPLPFTLVCPTYTRHISFWPISPFINHPFPGPDRPLGPVYLVQVTIPQNYHSHLYLQPNHLQDLSSTISTSYIPELISSIHIVCPHPSKKYYLPTPSKQRL